MKEITCICGERVVFLDPEVETKTCPNCGMPVRQYALPVREEHAEPARKRKTHRVSRKTAYAAGGIGLFLVIVAILFGLDATRRSAISQAGASVRDAEAAEERGDLNTAAGSYRRAIGIYERWGSTPEILKPLQAALARVEQSLAKAALDGARDPKANDLLSISLEELARQAYNGAPEAFPATFGHDYAGRVAILQGRVEEGTGSAYKASALTISYKVFSPSGDPIELSFDGPFFERYRLKQGADCIIKAVLGKVYLDRGGPDQTGHWVLVFDGAKSSLVTDSDQLKGLGWKLDDETINLVGAQRALSPAY